MNNPNFLSLLHHFLCQLLIMLLRSYYTNKHSPCMIYYTHNMMINCTWHGWHFLETPPCLLHARDPTYSSSSLACVDYRHSVCHSHNGSSVRPQSSLKTSSCGLPAGNRLYSIVCLFCENRAA